MTNNTDTRLCTRCNQPPEQVGRGDGCNDPYCSTTRCISQRVVSPGGYRSSSDWLEQTWTNGNKSVSVALPPKHSENDGNEVIYDYDAGVRMAHSLLQSGKR